MTMPDTNYPPTTTRTLGEALAAAETAVGDEQGADGDGGTDIEQRHVQALRWAVHGDDAPDGFDGWGSDAEVTLEAFTRASRNHVLDEANRKTMGPLGSADLSAWLTAGALQAAPWIDAGDDLAARKQATDQLPPALGDWLDLQLERLNTLGVGAGGQDDEGN